MNDLIHHDTESDDGCICGPSTEPVKRDDGSVGWVVVHHSLDGREFREKPYATKRKCRECQQMGRNCSLHVGMPRP
jgi:hypothetical protein